VGIAKGIASGLGKFFSSGAGELIDKASAAADRFITTDEDKRRFAMDMEGIKLDARRLELEAEKMQLDDVASARAMFQHDSWLQKIFAITFLAGYFLITIAMMAMLISFIGRSEVVVPEWGIALLSTIFGAMSSKVNTITDFLFGSSQGSRDKDSSFAEDVKKIMGQKE